MDKWRLLNEELRGAVRDKIWVTNGIDNALFKPDTDKHESKIEYEFFRIATALGISCAKTESISLFDKQGTLSYDFKIDNTKIYCPVSKLYVKSGMYTYISRDSNDNNLSSANDVSFCAVTLRAPNVLNQLVDMLYIDCLLCNRDRHGSNWELVMDECNRVCAIAPLFDHGNSMWFSEYDEFLDRSLVFWDINDICEPLHFELFAKLVTHSPVLIKDLIVKTEKIALNDFVSPRFEKMKAIFYEVFNNSSLL